VQAARLHGRVQAGRLHYGRGQRVNTVRATAGLGAATAMLAFGWAAVRPADPPGAAGLAPESLIGKPGPAPAPSVAVGTSGCNGIACHGQPVAGLVPQSCWGADGVEADHLRWRSSATVWKAYDRHAQAYAVLKNDLSRQIEARLARPGEKAHADGTTDVRCLACHANPTLATQPGHRHLADGVSCEACHGNASEWIKDHAGWPAGPGHSDMYGWLAHLSDPKVRAETCAGCHIGAPAGGGVPLRDMNHDLIAAGHPRLNFDYGTYLRALPPHWAEKDRNVPPPNLRPIADEYRHWLVGRAATTAAIYRLRDDRIGRGPWPELAEFDCYACHHGLKGEKQALLGPRPGELVWNEPPFAAKFADAEFRDVRTALTAPLGSTYAQKQARQLAEVWDRLAGRWSARPLPATEVTALLADVTPRRWDEACHLYYALLALDRAAGRPTDPRLTEIRDALRLPRESDGARFNSPKGFDPARLPFPDLFRERAR
jgi:hypothetical protein